jgi:hypothetical protein
MDVFAAGMDGLDLRAALASGVALCIAGPYLEVEYWFRPRGRAEALSSSLITQDGCVEKACRICRCVCMDVRDVPWAREGGKAPR